MSLFTKMGVAGVLGMSLAPDVEATTGDTAQVNEIALARLDEWLLPSEPTTLRAAGYGIVGGIGTAGLAGFLLSRRFSNSSSTAPAPMPLTGPMAELVHTQLSVLTRFRHHPGNVQLVQVEGAINFLNHHFQNSSSSLRGAEFGHYVSELEHILVAGHSANSFPILRQALKAHLWVSEFAPRGQSSHHANLYRFLIETHGGEIGQMACEGLGIVRDINNYYFVRAFGDRAKEQGNQKIQCTAALTLAKLGCSHLAIKIAKALVEDTLEAEWQGYHEQGYHGRGHLLSTENKIDLRDALILLKKVALDQPEAIVLEILIQRGLLTDKPRLASFYDLLDTLSECFGNTIAMDLALRVKEHVGVTSSLTDAANAFIRSKSTV